MAYTPICSLHDNLKSAALSGISSARAALFILANIPQGATVNDDQSQTSGRPSSSFMRNDWPQPQEAIAFGLWIVKPPLMPDSL